MASTFTEGFEGGTLAASLTNANTGFTSVVTGSTSAPYFANAAGGLATPHRGTFCAHFDAVAENIQVQKSFTATGTQYFRFYMYLHNAPTATTIIAHARSGATARAQIRLLTDRTLQLRNSTTAVWTSTNVVPTGQWCRIEWRLVNGTAQQLRLYTGANVDSAVTTLEDSGNQTFNTGTFDNVLYGVITATTTVFALDEVAHDDTTWVGPVAGITTVTPSRVQAVAAMSAPTVTGGSAGGATATPAKITCTASVGAATTGQPAGVIALRNGFETGADEVTITTANSGGSGNSAFDVVTIGTSATAVYDTAQFVHGTRSGRFATAATAGVSYVQWDEASMGRVGEGWWRFYIRLDALPAASRFIAQWRDTTTAATNASLLVFSSGVLALNDSAGEVFRSTFALAADTWYRVEVHLDFSITVGRADMWIYDVPESTTAVDTQSSAANRNLDAECNRFRIGHVSSAASQPNLWVDEPAFSTTGKIGPVNTVASASAGVIAATAAIPSAAPTQAGVGKATPAPIACSASMYLPASAGATGGGSAIKWGASCNYGFLEKIGTRAMTDDESFTRFRGEMAPVVFDHFHTYTTPAAGGIPTTVASSSGLMIAKNQGLLNVELNIKTDWVSNGATGPWLTKLTQCMDAIKAEAPGWTPLVRFNINHEADNSTADPTVDRALAEQQAGFWRTHAVALARHIWNRNDPQFMAQVTFMGFTGRVRLDGTRVAKWLPFDPYWDAPFTAFEKANKIILAGDIYPRLDANGNISTNMSGEDQRMAAQTKIFDIFYGLGYRRFAFSESAYNTDLATNTQEAKVRDAIRGYTSTGATVPGSLGEWLRTTPYNIEFFSWYESNLDTVYHTLHVSATRMQGYKDLITSFRAASGSVPLTPVPATVRPITVAARTSFPEIAPATGGAINIRPTAIGATASISNAALVIGAVTFSWTNVLANYADWTAVQAAHATWQSLMDGIVSGGTVRPFPATITAQATIATRIPSGGATPDVVPPPPDPGPIPTSLTVSSRWDNVIRGSQVLELRVDAYRYSAQFNRQVLLASDLPIVPDSASITMDGESEARRTCDLVIADPTLVPISPADILTPHGTELHVRRGFRYPDGVVEMVPVGIYRIDRPSTPMLGAVKVSGVDRSRLIAEDKFLHATQSVSGATVVAEITRLIYNSYPGGDVTVINRTSDTTVCRRTTWEADTSPWEAIQELALSIDADVGVDAAGQFVIRNMPQLTDAPVWSVDIGQTGVLIGGTEEWDRERVYNAVVARSEPTDGSNPLQYVAYDLDPSSPTYWHGTFGHRPRSYSSPLLQSVGACAAAANTILRKTTAPARTLRVECIPNPSLDFGDVVTVVLPPLAEGDNPRVERHMVWSYTMPLGLGSMDMNLFSSNPGGE